MAVINLANDGEFIEPEDTYLRDWQKNNLSTYKNKTGVVTTVVYQGNGKTLFSAVCFISDVLNKDISNLSLNEIKTKYTSVKKK